jgi:penicillin-binding protein 2
MAWRNRTSRYGIDPDRGDEWVAPEETLVDAASHFADIEFPVGEAIWRIGTLLSTLGVLIIVGGAAWLSVVDHDFFAAASWRNRTVDVSVPPPRGIIMDRNGAPLVQNMPSFDLLAIGREIDRAADGTLPGILPLARALGRDPEDLTLQINDQLKNNAVFFVATDIPRDRVLSLTNNLPTGFSLITSTKRLYVDGEKFSQIIGYVGKVSKADMASDSYYLPSDTIGRLGIEASYEDILRGTHGQLVFDVSGVPEQQPASAGGNVVLTVDASIQTSLWNSVSSVLRETGLSQAAAVVQDPRSGAVLGLVSFPAYDNNDFSGQLSQEQADQLFNDRRRPLFDRVISGLYNPGSTIKPYIGMTALQEGLITPHQTVVNNCISLSVPNPNDPEHPYVYDNWRPDIGPFDLFRAVADSCNVYFMTIGGGHDSFTGLGVNRITNYLKAGLADKRLGIDLPGEAAGFVPTPDWKLQTKGTPWYQGDTYNISLGQGDLSVTPLWLNTYVSAIANGGTIWQPQIASRVVDEQKQPITVFPQHQLGTLPFSTSVIRTMQTAMRQTVTGGTAKLFNDLPVSVAAKTGTAEIIKGARINSLVTAYAPADDPQVTITVLIEGSASNQGYALRAAHAFLQWYFGTRQK